ncbi:MAG: MCE family protein [Sphingobacteriales bacterium]|nr:MAG: MCE family protein [Sphingobacteriales bacterium]
MAEGKKRHEIKIGILALVSILALFFGFNFFKGNNLFSREKEYITYFDNVEGLSTSSKVMINGYQVGKVSELEMQPDHRFKVIMLVNHEFTVTEGSVVEQVGSDLLSGAKNIAMVPSTSKTPAEEGTVLRGVEAVGLMDGITQGVPGVMDNLGRVTSNADTLMTNLKGIVSDNTGKHIEQILTSVELAMKQIEILSQSLARQSGNINTLMTNANGTINNLQRVSNTLANDGRIDRILGNAEQATHQFSEAKIEQTINNLETTTQKLNTLISKLDKNEGTLGLLVNDPKLYNSLNQTVTDLGKLSQDLKEHPGRYINISLFPSKARKE